MKKFFTLLSLICFFQITFAAGVQIGDLYYNLNDKDKTAEVTYQSSSNNYSGLPSVLEIPATVPYKNENYAVTSIGEGSFRYCSNIIKVTIPEGVTTIGKSAFSECYNLTSISFPKTLKSVFLGAFQGSSRIREVHIPSLEVWCNISFELEPTGPPVYPQISNPTYYSQNLYVNGMPLSGIVKLPENLTKIGYHQFYYLDKVTEFILPESLNTIDNFAFYGCSGLKSIKLPENLTKIGASAFYKCSGLTSITIPENVTDIGKRSFSGCKSLSSINIPGNVTKIEDYTFNECSSLASITIPENVAMIGAYAFYECSALTSITIPENVTEIGSHAFTSCYGLTSITIPENVTEISDHTFFGCSSLTSIKLPENMTMIGSDAFYRCSKLTSINLPEKLQSIGYQAFYECIALPSITLSENVIEIGSKAFYGCSNLLEVIDLGTSPAVIKSDSFASDTKNSGKLFVPESAIDAYKRTTYWNDFKSINEIESASAIEIIGSVESIPEGNSTQLYIRVIPDNTTYYKIKWSSSANDIATVDQNGIVKGISPGDVTITATETYGSGTQATYSLKVTESFGSFTIDDFEISTNMTLELPVSLINEKNTSYSGLQFNVSLPAGLELTDVKLGEELTSANCSLRYQTYDNDISKVIVTLGSAGEGINATDKLLYLQVKANNEATQGVKNLVIYEAILSDKEGSEIVLNDSSCEVTFLPTVKSITLTPQNQNITFGSEGSITATVEPANAANTQLNWTVEGEDGVIQLQGEGLNATFTTLKLGLATVKVTSPYDETITAVATVNVVDNLLITSKRSVIKVKETEQLAAHYSLTPGEAAMVTWSSSSPEVASVDPSTGLVTGLQDGKAVITATDNEKTDITATYQIVVEPILLGDANDNGKVNVSDVVTIANKIAEKPVANWCFVNADADENNILNVADVTTTVNIIMDVVPSKPITTRSSLNGGDDILVVSDFEALPGENIEIPVWLDNSIAYSSLQASIIIPEGMNVEEVTAGPRAKYHSLVYNLTEGDVLKVVIYSLSNAPFAEGDEALFTLHVSFDSECGDLVVEDVIASNETQEEYFLSYMGGRSTVDTTNIDAEFAEKVVVVNTAEGIEILNASGKEISVYSISGETIASRRSQNLSETFKLAKGVYIVRVDDYVVKIVR